MLSKPNVNELMKKAGNRYEASLAIAKRARTIARRRVERGDSNIKDTVDMAANEIFEEKALVKRDGIYILKNKNCDDLDVVISKTVDDILKDLAVKDESLEMEKPNKKEKKIKKNEIKKEIIEEIVEEIVEEKPVKKVVKKKVKKDEE
ncbi:MAG: DNA-directed RNA polymerase subunit omega [Clostridia bacterium]